MKRIAAIKRGQPITARYLTGMAEGINDVQTALARARNASMEAYRRSNADQTNLDPRQLDDPATRGQDDQIVAADEQAYIESARTTVPVRVENPSDPSQYVDVDRIARVRLVNAAGEALELVLALP